MDFFEKQKVFFTLYDDLTENVRKKYALSGADFDVLMFLYNNPQYNTAAQVVRYRKIVKSQVSVAVARLVSRGFITAEYAEGNKKSVILTITEEGNIAAEEGRTAQKKFADTIFCGFDEKEIEGVKSFFRRVLENAENYIKEKK